MNLNGGTLDISNSNLNIEGSNITLIQNYGIAGGITDVCSNMFNISNSNFSFPENIVFGSNLALNNLWTGKNTINNDVSFNNTKTQINSSSLIGLSGDIVNISGGSVTVAGYTTIGGGSTTFNSNNIYLNSIPSTSDLSCISYNPTTKQIGYVNLPNNLPTNNVWTGTNTFSTDVSFNSGTARFNNTTTQITSSSLVGLSGGVVSISGGTVNISGATTFSGSTTLSGSTTFSGSTIHNGTTNTFSSTTTQINGSSLVGLSGGVVSISGSTINIASSNINLPNLNNSTTTSTKKMVIFDNSNTNLSYSSDMKYSVKSYAYLQKLVGTSASAQNQGFCLAYSPDGLYLVTGAPGNNNVGSIHIFKKTAGTYVWSQQLQQSSPYLTQGFSVAFSPDSSLIAVGAPNYQNESVVSVGRIILYSKDVNGNFNYSTYIDPTTTNVAQQLGVSVAFSPDGLTLASGAYADNGSVGCVYTFTRPNTSSGWSFSQKLISGLSVGAALEGYSVAISPNGLYLAVGAAIENSNCGSTYVYYRATSAITSTFSLLQKLVPPFPGNAGNRVAFSPDGTILASSAYNDVQEYSIGCTHFYTLVNGLWSWSQKMVGPVLKTETAQYQGAGIAFSPDSSTFAHGATADNYSVGCTHIFKKNSLGQWIWYDKLVASGGLQRSQSQGYAVAFSPDNSQIAVGAITDNSNVGAIHLFTNSESSTLQKYSLDVSGNFNLGDGLITSTTNNNPFLLFDEIGRYAYNYMTTSTPLSPNGNMLMLADMSMCSFRVMNYNQLTDKWTQYGEMRYNSNSPYGGAGMSANPSNANPNNYFGVNGAFSAKGTLVVASPNEGASVNGVIWIYDMNNNSWKLRQPPISGFPNGSYVGFALAISNDDSTLAFGSSGGINGCVPRIYALNTATNQYEEATFTATGIRSTSIALSDNGNVFVYSNLFTSSIYIYRRTSGTKTWNYSQTITQSSPYTNAGVTVCLSADGNTLAYYADGYVLVHTYNGGTSLFNVTPSAILAHNINSADAFYKNRDVKCMDMSKDAKKIFICGGGGGALHKYYVHNGTTYVEQVLFLPENSTSLNASFSYDGNTLAVCDYTYRGNFGKVSVYSLLDSRKQLNINNVDTLNVNGSINIRSTSTSCPLVIQNDCDGGNIAGLWANGKPSLLLTNNTPSCTSGIYTNNVNSRPGLAFGISSGIHPTTYIAAVAPYGNTNTTFTQTAGWLDLQMYAGNISLMPNLGSVGIGTANPYSSNKLEVAGAISSSDRSGTGVNTVITSFNGAFGTIECFKTDNTVANKLPLCIQAYGGNVGIGTTTPKTNIKLDVNGTARFDNIRFSCYDNTTDGTGGYQSRIFQGNSGGGGYGNNFNANTLVYSSYGDVGAFGGHLFRGGNATAHGPSYDIVSIGGGYNVVNIYDTTGLGHWFFNRDGTFGCQNLSDTSEKWAIYNNGNFYIGGVIKLSSDRRIKSNIVDINDEYALSILRKIKPKTYDYIDIKERGKYNVIGFIAQEIGEIIPNAISLAKKIVPNFYTNCSVSITDVSNILLVASPIDLSWNPLHDQCGNSFIDADGNACSDASGNKEFIVSLKDKNNKETTYKTTNILNNKTFLIDISGTTFDLQDEYFLYGQQIDDFHILDKNAIFTVVTAAVQDIDRIQQESLTQIQVHEAQIQAQQVQIQESLTQIQVHEAQIQAQQVQIQAQQVQIQAQQEQIQSLITKQQEDAITISGLTSEIDVLKSQLSAIMVKLGM